MFENVEYYFIYDGQFKRVSQEDLAGGGVKYLWWGVVFTKNYSKKIRNGDRYYRRYRNIGMRMKKTRRGRRK